MALLTAGLAGCGGGDEEGYTDAEIESTFADAEACLSMIQGYNDVLDYLLDGGDMSAGLIDLRATAISSSATAHSSDLVGAFMAVPSNQEETVEALDSWGSTMLEECKSVEDEGKLVAEWMDETGWEPSAG